MAILTKKRAIKIGICFLILYAAIVILFETLLGTTQPTYDGIMIITSFEEDGEAIDRVVARLDLEGQIYVAVNHWPRAWARRIQRNPEVQLTYQGETWNYTSVVLEGAEHDQGAIDFSVPFSFRFLTGFPPRYFFRFDPKANLIVQANREGGVSLPS